MAEVGQAFEFAGRAGGNHYLLAGSNPPSGLSHEGGHVAVIARSGLRLEHARLSVIGTLSSDGQALEQKALVRFERASPLPWGEVVGLRRSRLAKRDAFGFAGGAGLVIRFREPLVEFVCRLLECFRFIEDNDGPLAQIKQRGLRRLQ